MSHFEDEAQVAVDASVEMTPDAETPLEVEEEVVEGNEVAETATEEHPTATEPEAYQPYPVDGRPA